MIYYADEFNVSWMPTLRAMWSPQEQHDMIPTPGQPTEWYGLGAVNYQTGETVVLFRRRTRHREVAELLQAVVDKHPTGTIGASAGQSAPAAQWHHLSPAHRLPMEPTARAVWRRQHGASALPALV